MIEWKEDRDEIVIEQVQLTDIEDSAYVGSRQAIVGKQMGNYLWRSPEAHAQGKVHKYSDIFSFGIVVSLVRNSLDDRMHINQISRTVHLRRHQTRHLRRR